MFLYDCEPVAGRMALSSTSLRASQSDSPVDAFDDGRRKTIEAGREADTCKILCHQPPAVTIKAGRRRIIIGEQTESYIRFQRTI